MVTIEFKKLRYDAKVPTFANTSDAGMDFYSNEPAVIMPGERKIIGTGVSMQFKLGLLEKLMKKVMKTKYVLDIRCKSGRALREGFMLTNGVGTVDEDYRGEIKGIITNTGNIPLIIERGEKIFQGVTHVLPHVNICLTDVKLSTTIRDRGGFGSTGLK